MPRRPRPPPPAADEPVERLEDRWLLQEQTARNLAGLEAEQAGRLDEAVALYERNSAEGFPGDWPYGRLVAIYEKRGALGDAERTLLRAIEVLAATDRRTKADRRALVQVFKKRLALLRRRRRTEEGSARPAR